MFILHTPPFPLYFPFELQTVHSLWPELWLIFCVSDLFFQIIETSGFLKEEVILNWSWGAEICQSLFWVCLLKVFCLFVCFDEINSGISSLNIVDCITYQEWLQFNQLECNSVFFLLVGSSSSCLILSAGTKDQLFSHLEPVSFHDETAVELSWVTGLLPEDQGFLSLGSCLSQSVSVSLRDYNAGCFWETLTKEWLFTLLWHVLWVSTVGITYIGIWGNKR